jgi:hypothetical protein
MGVAPGSGRAISPAGHVRALRRCGAPPINVDAAPTSRSTVAPPATGCATRSPRSPELDPGASRRLHLPGTRPRTSLGFAVALLLGTYYVMTFSWVVPQVRRVRGLGAVWRRRGGGRSPAGVLGRWVVSRRPRCRPRRHRPRTPARRGRRAGRRVRRVRSPTRSRSVRVRLPADATPSPTDGIAGSRTHVDAPAPIARATLSCTTGIVEVPS